ncbi:hypothetical protein [Halodesulfovibrio sp.]|uniref:hypothetical protein n=1 Tax=Halodesulfovibrio sp. TaxID=1912772 RepID=UPI0025BE840A|nr:hypothetical protein [Halodesulfovibrio sp.]
MNRWLRILLELLPLQVFAFSFRYVDVSQPDSWMMPFYVAAAVALVTFAIFIKKHAIPDPVIIGINMYILLSAALLGGGTVGFPVLLADLKAAGILGVVFLVSLFLYGTKPQWLLVSHNQVPEKFTQIQLAVTAVCFVVSFVFRENVFVSGLLMLGVLYLARQVLCDQLQKFGFVEQAS